MSNTESGNSIVIPVPLSVHLLNPVDIWSKHVRSRQIVYLDTSVWISLTEARDPKAKECLMVCREAVREKVAIFPLSFASIGELLRQPPQAPKDLQAALMDELSEGVTFRSPERIQIEEAKAAFNFFFSDQYSPNGRATIFSYVIDFLGDGSLEFKAGVTAERVRKFVEIFGSMEEVRSVSWLLRQEIENSASDDQIDSEFVASMTETIRANEARLRSQKRFSTERVRIEERSAVLESSVIPAFINIILKDGQPADIKAFESLATRLLEDFRRKHGKGGPRLMEGIFQLMPATELYVQLMAARGMNPSRVVRKQDFWDIEHARTSGAYSDAVVTLDRGLADLLTIRSSVPRERGCRVIRSLYDLAAFVREGLDPKRDGASPEEKS